MLRVRLFVHVQHPGSVYGRIASVSLAETVLSQTPCDSVQEATGHNPSEPLSSKSSPDEGILLKETQPAVCLYTVNVFIRRSSLFLSIAKLCVSITCILSTNPWGATWWKWRELSTVWPKYSELFTTMQVVHIVKHVNVCRHVVLYSYKPLSHLFWICFWSIFSPKEFRAPWRHLYVTQVPYFTPSYNYKPNLFIFASY